MRFATGDDSREIDRSLASKIDLAMRWFGEVKTGVSIKASAEPEGLTRDRVSPMLRLGRLDPKIVDAISSGCQPDRLTSDAIFKSPHIALWSELQVWGDGL